MTAFALDETATVIRELALAADAFALRAQEQEACRDRAQPGTAVYLDAGNALWKPVDVMVERLRGAGWAMLCWIAGLWLQRRHQIEGSGNGGA